MKFCICLPSGNKPEFMDIEIQLSKRGVEYVRKNLVSGGTIFEFDESQIPKLPVCSEGPFVPVDDESGYSFYEVGSSEDLLFKGIATSEENFCTLALLERE